MSHHHWHKGQLDPNNDSRFLLRASAQSPPDAALLQDAARKELLAKTAGVCSPIQAQLIRLYLDGRIDYGEPGHKQQAAKLLNTTPGSLYVQLHRLRNNPTFKKIISASVKKSG